MGKCDNCEKEGQDMIDITNFTVTYESSESYNCCSEECAKKCAKSDGIEEDEIITIE